MSKECCLFSFTSLMVSQVCVILPNPYDSQD